MDGEPEEEADVKETRLEHPSGFLLLTRYPSVPIIIDALLVFPPGEEFNTKELANTAGISEETVEKYLPLLLKLDVVEEVPGTTPIRYKVAGSNVVEEIFHLNSALNMTGPE